MENIPRKSSYFHTIRKINYKMIGCPTRHSGSDIRPTNAEDRIANSVDVGISRYPILINVADVQKIDDDP